ncbi:MAG TPA: hypothetical protein VNF47_25930 [Streptosporangiaceae bacterium]|nr:hypothetical protein [Streptosporangiaceae bacterium]
MTLRVPAAAIAPDLRFGAAGALADPARSVEIGGLVIRAEGCLPQSAAIPRYLRYADRDAVIVADGVGELQGLESCLSDQIRAGAECDALDELSTAVIALDAVVPRLSDPIAWKLCWVSAAPVGVVLAPTLTLMPPRKWQELAPGRCCW